MFLMVIIVIIIIIFFLVHLVLLNDIPNCLAVEVGQCRLCR